MKCCVWLSVGMFESLSMNCWRVKMHCDIDWHDDLSCWDTLWQQCNIKICHEKFVQSCFALKKKLLDESSFISKWGCILAPCCADHVSFFVLFCWFNWGLEQQRQQRKHPIWSHGFSKSKISLLDRIQNSTQCFADSCSDTKVTVCATS